MSQDKTFTVVIKLGGDLRFIYDDDLRFLSRLGKSKTTRASTVEPVELLDHTLWEADMALVGGPKLGPYAKRRTALLAEKLWIEEYAL